MAVIYSKLSASECSKRIKEEVDFISLGFGTERITGWTKFGFFRMEYFGDKEFGKRYFPIFKKVSGIIREEHGRTKIKYFFSHGLLDPISMILMFLCTFIIILLAPDGELLKLGEVIQLSMLWTGLVGVTTGAMSRFSITGIEYEIELIDYLTGLMEIEDVQRDF